MRRLVNAASSPPVMAAFLFFGALMLFARPEYALPVAAVLAAAGCAEEQPSAEALRKTYDYYASTVIKGEAGEWRHTSVGLSGKGVHVRLALPDADAEAIASAPREEGVGRLARAACPPQEHEIWTALDTEHDILLTAQKISGGDEFLKEVSCRSARRNRVAAEGNSP